MPVRQAIELATRALESAEATKLQRADALEVLAYLIAQEGRLEAARDHLRQAETEFLELGHVGMTAQIWMTRGLVERFARDSDASAAAFRTAYDLHAKRGTLSMVPFLAARLGQALIDAGRPDDARVFIDEAEQLEPRDIWTGSIVGLAGARLLVHDGRAPEGLVLAREVLAWGRSAGLENLAILFGNALEDLGGCAQAAGEVAAAREALEEALEVYEAKGDLVDAAHVRAELGRLDG
jgi:tetratricopeptide (TPR) repeat protein